MDGTVLFCVDYRKLNAVTRKDAYPLPRVDMTLDTIAASHWFSILDLISGYWQNEISAADKKTAFCKPTACPTFHYLTLSVMPGPTSPVS